MKRRMTQFLQWIKNDKGFSLIELVVAISIMIVLTAGGLIAYTALTKNAKQAAVNSAADSVYTATMGYLNDGLDETTVQTAAEEWNSKVNDQNPAFTPFGNNDLTGINNDVTGSTNGNTKVKVFVDDLGNDRIKVTAIYAKNEVEATKMSPGVGESTTAPTTPVEPSETIKADITPPYMSFNPQSRMDMTIIQYTCSVNTTSTLPFIGFGDKADVVTQSDSDMRKNKFDVTNVSNKSSMNATAKANDTLTATLYGTYNELNFGKGFANCDVTVKFIGPDTGVTKITQIGANAKTTFNVPDVGMQLPSTVTNLDNLFVPNAKIKFDGGNSVTVNGNDSNGYLFELWDTSNVTSMKESFVGFQSFTDYSGNKKLDLSRWDTSKVTDHTDFDKDATGIISPSFN